jgi:cysteine-rich repeat protein
MRHSNFARISLATLLVFAACDCSSEPPVGGDANVNDPDGIVPDVFVPPVPCGNGVLNEGEECDDGNRLDGDGCSASCQFEHGWDCFADVCIPSACGDGVRVGPEECDDGNRISGDGCSIRCTIEPGWVCVTENFPCRRAVCGDGAIEAQEQCDDGNDDPGDGCDANCQLEPGFHCPVPGQPCLESECGNGVVEGLEQCDDGNDDPGDGCDANCQLEPGFHCPTEGAPCAPSVCGNGVREGLEGCDDGNLASGDGCSDTCTVEPFYQCTGEARSVCKKPVEFVRIARFEAPMQQPQAVHYDPQTRSFVAYNYSTGAESNDAQEFCLDGETTEIRDAHLEARRALVGSALDGAAYDPFRDRFLFVRQNGRIYEIDRDNNVTASIDGFQLNGLGTAGGVQVGDDGRVYATSHYNEGLAHPTGEGFVRVFVRNVDGSLNPNSVHMFFASNYGTLASDGIYLDNLFNIPGVGWMGFYNRPYPPLPDPSHEAFIFHDYEGGLVGISSIPGPLFRNGERFPGRADGGEAAADGGYFLVCSEYHTHSSNGGEVGICQLFAQVCESSLDCAERVPGTVCKLDDGDGDESNDHLHIPYCYAAAHARNDRYTVDPGVTEDLDVLVNDTFADAVCSGADTTILETSEGSHGGSISIVGAEIRYTSAVAANCGFIERFTYTADLGDGVARTAEVEVTVPCECGNGVVEPGEECDDPEDVDQENCTDTCRLVPRCGNGIVEPGEQCDDGNNIAGDGCSPVCTWEFFIPG